MRHTFVEPGIAQTRYSAKTRVQPEPAENIKQESPQTIAMSNGGAFHQNSTDNKQETPLTVRNSNSNAVENSTPAITKPQPSEMNRRSFPRSLSANQIITCRAPLVTNNPQTANRPVQKVSPPIPSPAHLDLASGDCNIVAGNLGQNGQALRDNSGPNTPTRYVK